MTSIYWISVHKLHFIGCGGGGMYPLIQILAAKGYQITGSDVLDGTIIRRAGRWGPGDLGHKADNVIGSDMVVLIRQPLQSDNWSCAQRSPTASPPLSAACCWAMWAACTRTASAYPAPTAKPPLRQ